MYSTAQFGAALARGKVMVCFEAKWSRGCTPLNALPLTTPIHFSAKRFELLDLAREHRGRRHARHAHVGKC